jgi:sialate O-acetylesterase
MIKNIGKTKSLLLFLFIGFQLKADIKLPSIFGDNMVLQQQESVAIWGKSAPEKMLQ